MQNLTSTAAVLRQTLRDHHEWLLDADGQSFYLLSNEIHVSFSADALEITFPDDQGCRPRRLKGISFENGIISLEFSARIQNSYTRADLVPRTKAVELKESVESARMKAAGVIAAKLSEQFPGFKPLRVALNEHNGRFAEILAQKGIRHLAVLADVSGIVTHEALLSKAIIWLRALNARKKHRVETVWIVADKKSENPLRALSACLKESVSASIPIWKSKKQLETTSETNPIHFVDCNPRKFNSLWSGSLPRLQLLKDKNPTRFASGMKELGQGGVDRVFSAKGETLRYKGLPFARTRIVSSEEKVWFGVDEYKTPLGPETMQEFENMFANLEEYRSHDTPNKQHEFYRGAPEAWLESILRRNINALDANLILSPIYNQFRAAGEKIDLLALRRDGRLVIIELKIAPDRDMVFQAVDYWRKVESQRKRGNLNEARLFGDVEIADRPTAVYLVAPTLGFHSDLDFLAGKVLEQIEIYRFDLAENWRERVSVLRRRRMGN